MICSKRLKKLVVCLTGFYHMYTPQYCRHLAFRTFTSVLKIQLAHSYVYIYIIDIYISGAARHNLILSHVQFVGLRTKRNSFFYVH